MKAKLNINNILSRTNSQFSIKFNDFIFDNKDREFTPKLELETTLMKLYSLEEDIHCPKWIFLETDLIFIDKGRI